MAGVNGFKKGLTNLQMENAPVIKVNVLELRGGSEIRECSKESFDPFLSSSQLCES